MREEKVAYGKKVTRVSFVLPDSVPGYEAASGVGPASDLGLRMLAVSQLNQSPSSDLSEVSCSKTTAA